MLIFFKKGETISSLPNSEAIADKRTSNPLRSEEKKERTYFKSDWTHFKANNSVSPIGHTSSQIHVPLINLKKLS